MRKLWIVVVVAVGLWLVPGVAWAQQSQTSNAEQTGKGFSDMIQGAAGWLGDFAEGPNGRYLGYGVLIVLGVWLARRTGVMRG